MVSSFDPLLLQFAGSFRLVSRAYAQAECVWCSIGDTARAKRARSLSKLMQEEQEVSALELAPTWFFPGMGVRCCRCILRESACQLCRVSISLPEHSTRQSLQNFRAALQNQAGGNKGLAWDWLCGRILDTPGRCILYE